MESLVWPNDLLERNNRIIITTRSQPAATTTTTTTNPISPTSVLQPDGSYLPEEDCLHNRPKSGQSCWYLVLYMLGRKPGHKHQRRGRRWLFPVRAGNVGLADQSAMASYYV